MDRRTDCIGRGDPVPGEPGQHKCALCNHVWSLTPERHLAEHTADTTYERRP